MGTSAMSTPVRLAFLALIAALLAGVVGLHQRNAALEAQAASGGAR